MRERLLPVMVTALILAGGLRAMAQAGPCRPGHRGGRERCGIA